MSLSDKIMDEDDIRNMGFHSERAFVKARDVRTVVKELRNSLCLNNMLNGCNECIICKDIKSIFGEKLT